MEQEQSAWLKERIANLKKGDIVRAKDKNDPHAFDRYSRLIAGEFDHLSKSGLYVIKVYRSAQLISVKKKDIVEIEIIERRWVNK
jgi:hypothetical protein